MSKIVTDISKNVTWVVRRSMYNPFTVTFTSSSAAFSIASYTFSANVKKIGSDTAVVALTTGSGITNGGANGILTVVLSEANSALLNDDVYFWELLYVVSSNTYTLLQGSCEVHKQISDEPVDTSITLSVNLAGDNVTIDVDLGGTDATAIHDNVANEYSAVTEKVILVNDDLFLIEDSAASFVKKRVKKSNVSSGAGGHTIKENGTTMTTRTSLNFQGFDLTDDSSGDATIVNNVAGNLFLYYNFY
jgi:hypothetical protein